MYHTNAYLQTIGDFMNSFYIFFRNNAEFDLVAAVPGGDTRIGN